MVVLRDTRTTGGALLPDARTSLFKLRSDGELDDSVITVVSGKRLVAMGARSGRIGLFPTDTTSSVIPVTQNVKGTTAVVGTSMHVPSVSLKIESGELISIQISKDDALLYVVTSEGLHAVDLTQGVNDLMLKPVVTVHKVHAAVVVEDKQIVVASDQGLSSFSFVEDSLTVGAEQVIDSRFGKPWNLCCEESVFACTFGSESVSVFDAKNNAKFEAKLSPQSGEVSRVMVLAPGCIPMLGSEGFGAVVAQRDVISVFGTKEGELELVFQFRDAINKLQCSSVDLCGSFLLSISSDNFSRRDRLELFDLSFLKPKSAGLGPLRRWDISRLTADVEHADICFVKNRDLLSFVLTGPGACASLWEPAVKDQWFAVMPNFEVLNKNEPFQEREEEFDFNQHASEDEVRRTINRYKKTQNVEFNFVPNDVGRGARKNEDIEIASEQHGKAYLATEPMLPFLQPLKSWREKTAEKFQPCPVSSAKATFFSESAPKVLARRIQGK